MESTVGLSLSFEIVVLENMSDKISSNFVDSARQQSGNRTGAAFGLSLG
jgi:hypothetical protein